MTNATTTATTTIGQIFSNPNVSYSSSSTGEVYTVTPHEPLSR